MDSVGPRTEAGEPHERRGLARYEELGRGLEWHIEQIEDSCCREDTTRWKEAVFALRDAARSIGADRIVATASSLLDMDPFDVPAISELLNRLRSEFRISALEEECRLQEEALAAELSALRPGTRRDLG